MDPRHWQLPSVSPPVHIWKNRYAGRYADLWPKSQKHFHGTPALFWEDVHHHIAKGPNLHFSADVYMSVVSHSEPLLDARSAQLMLMHFISAFTSHQ